MQNKVAILVDVDLTVVDSGNAWLDWMEDVYKTPADYGLMIEDRDTKGFFDYNLSRYFPSACKKQIGPYEFWEDPYLYDKLKPYTNCVEVIKRLHDAGHPIRFVSYCKKGHFSSKVRFLKYHFPFLDLDKGSDGSGFYATKVKAGVAGGVIIDDRNNFLNQFSDDVIKVKFLTPYSQEVAPRVKYDFESYKWEDIGKFLEETL
ncbi:hypothetical protein [Salmonella phage SSBI34]|nr:hypothetical protein [Salmonella phage SSBI34]